MKPNYISTCLAALHNFMNIQFTSRTCKNLALPCDSPPPRCTAARTVQTSGTPPPAVRRRRGRRPRASWPPGAAGSSSSPGHTGSPGWCAEHAPDAHPAWSLPPAKSDRYPCREVRGCLLSTISQLQLHVHLPKRAVSKHTDVQSKTRTCH